MTHSGDSKSTAIDASNMELFNLGISYATGRGVEKDFAKAFDYFREAEKKGFKESDATDYFTKSSDPKEKEAFEIYKLRNKTNTELVNKGNAYFEGKYGYVRDTQKAFHLLTLRTEH